VCLFVLCLCAAAAAAQSAASIGGNVIDPEGKAVVNATVLVRNEASADLRTAMTDATGHFSVSGLPTGIYTIEVAVPGFDLVERTGVELGNVALDLAIRLTVANIADLRRDPV